MRRDPLDGPQELIQRVYAYASYRLGPGPDAEDVTSETFARALRYRESYRPDQGKPIAWLIGIARHVVADSAGQRPGALANEIEAQTSIDDAETWVATADLHRALATLSQRDRELVALRYGADLTARQIGETLGLKTNAVEVALHRALERLRSVLGDPAAIDHGSAGTPGFGFEGGTELPPVTPR